MKVSVVVPVYNTEKFLGKCLDSILDNTFSDYEVLIINDGSTDGSKKVAREYVKKDKRIHLYNVEHLGVSNARNVGIEKAKGDYISFVDSDDTIEKSFLSSLYEYAVKHDLDWVYCGWTTRSDSSKEIYTQDYFRETFYVKGQEARKLAVDSVFKTENGTRFYSSLTSSCMCIFRRKILIDNNLRYNTDITFGEDMCFNYERAHYVNSFGYVCGYLYNIFIHSTSSSYVQLGQLENNVNTLQRSRRLFSDLEYYRNKYNDDYFTAYQEYFFAFNRNSIINAFKYLHLSNKIQFVKAFREYQYQEPVSQMFDKLESSFDIAHDLVNYCFLIALKTKHSVPIFFAGYLHIYASNLYVSLIKFNRFLRKYINKIFKK